MSEKTVREVLAAGPSVERDELERQGRRIANAVKARLDAVLDASPRQLAAGVRAAQSGAASRKAKADENYELIKAVYDEVMKEIDGDKPSAKVVAQVIVMDARIQAAGISVNVVLNNLRKEYKNRPQIHKQPH